MSKVFDAAETYSVPNLNRSFLKLDKILSPLLIKFEISTPQYGNFMIFLSLRFYVKSFFGIVEVQNLPF